MLRLLTSSRLAAPRFAAVRLGPVVQLCTEQPPPTAKKASRQGSKANAAANQKSRLIVKDSRGLAAAMVRLIDDADVEIYRKTLQTLRENPEIKEEVISKLKENSPSNPLHWWNTWLIRALNTKRSNLFPFAIETENKAEVMEMKANLATYLFAHVHPTDTPFRSFLLKPHPSRDQVAQPTKTEAMHYRRVSLLANDLGDKLSMQTMSTLLEVMKQMVRGELDQDGLVDAVTSQCNLHLDVLHDFFRVLEVPLTPIHKNLIQTRQAHRDRVTDRLASEIGHLVYSHNGVDSNLPSNRNFEWRSVGKVSTVIKRRPFVAFGAFHCLDVHMKCYAKTLTDGLQVSLPPPLVFEGSHSATSAAATSAGSAGSAKPLLGAREEDDAFRLFEPNSEQGPTPSTVSALLDTIDDASQPVVAADLSFTTKMHPHFSLLPALSADASPENKIMLENIPDAATEQDIRDALKNCGRVKKVWMFMRVDPADAEGAVGTRPAEEVAGSGAKHVTKGSYSEIHTSSKVEDNEVAHAQNLTELRDFLHESSAGLEDDVVEPLEEVHLDVSSDADTETDADATSVSGAARAAKAARSKFYKRKIKENVLQGNSTDNYAFVLMEDSEGYAAALHDDCRLFGISVRDPAGKTSPQYRTCKTHPLHHHSKLVIEMHEFMTVREINQLLNMAMCNKYECYLASPATPTVKPLFVKLRFRDHAECWMAFQMLLQACEDPALGYMFSPSWMLSKHYWKMHQRAREAMLNEEEMGDVALSKRAERS